jgi:hypothetical protein
MAKITFLGAGSTVFAKNVLGDCMCAEPLHGSSIAIYDIDAVRRRMKRMRRAALFAACMACLILSSGCLSSMLIDDISDAPIRHRYRIASFHKAWLYPDMTLAVCFTGAEPGRPGMTNVYTALVALPRTVAGRKAFTQYPPLYVQFEDNGVALPKRNVRRGEITEKQVLANHLTEIPIVSLTATNPGTVRPDSGTLARERSAAIRAVLPGKPPVWIIDDRAFTSQLPWWPLNTFLCVVPDEPNWPQGYKAVALEYCTPDYAEKLKWALLPVTLAADIILLPVEVIGCVVLVVMIESSGGLRLW